MYCNKYKVAPVEYEWKRINKIVWTYITLAYQCTDQEKSKDHSKWSQENKNQAQTNMDESNKKQMKKVVKLKHGDEP